MDIYVCIYAYVYIYVFMYMYMYLCIYVFMYMYFVECGPLCRIFCEHGNVLDEFGCPICECSKCNLTKCANTLQAIDIIGSMISV